MLLKAIIGTKYRKIKNPCQGFFMFFVFYVKIYYEWLGYNLIRVPASRCLVTDATNTKEVTIRVDFMHYDFVVSEGIGIC